MTVEERFIKEVLEQIPTMSEQFKKEIAPWIGWIDDDEIEELREVLPSETLGEYVCRRRKAVEKAQRALKELERLSELQGAEVYTVIQNLSDEYISLVATSLDACFKIDEDGSLPENVTKEEDEKYSEIWDKYFGDTNIEEE